MKKKEICHFCPADSIRPSQTWPKGKPNDRAGHRIGNVRVTLQLTQHGIGFQNGHCLSHHVIYDLLCRLDAFDAAHCLTCQAVHSIEDRPPNLLVVLFEVVLQRDDPLFTKLLHRLVTFILKKNAKSLWRRGLKGRHNYHEPPYPATEQSCP